MTEKFDTEGMLTAMIEGRTVPITAFSVEEAVANGTFRWKPPLIELSPDPKSLYLKWRAFQIVFDQIDDPAHFPPIQDHLPEQDLKVCRRHVAAAEELAESQLLSGSDRATFNWERNARVSVDAKFTSKEITRGFAVLLRQFDSNDEPASFNTVYNRLRKASTATTDSHGPRRCQHLDAWRAARGKLHGAELERLGRRAISPTMEYGSEHTPTHLLKVYNYGELLHWGRGRETLAEWQNNEHDSAWQRLSFLEAATGLAILYLGFSDVVRRAISLQP